MEVSIPVGAQPVVPQPERTPVAVRTAVARLDVTVLPRFEAEWTAATAQARRRRVSDWTWEYSPDAAHVVGGLTPEQIA
jgi:hypothetical protein